MGSSSSSSSNSESTTNSANDHIAEPGDIKFDSQHFFETILKDNNDIEEKDESKESLELEEMEKQMAQFEKEIKEMVSNPNLDAWLSILSKSIQASPNDIPFQSLYKSIDNANEIHKIFLQLKEFGVTKDARFKDEVDSLLALFQKQWRLLNKTLLVLQDLSCEAESCQWAIERWRNEMKLHYSEGSEEKPNMAKIEESVKELNNWLKNGSKVEKLLSEWTEFKEDAEKFQVKWDRVKDAITGHIKEKCTSWWNRNTNKVSCGGVGVGLGMIIAHSAAIAAIVASSTCIVVVGVTAAAIGGIASGYVYYKTRKTVREMKKKKEQIVQGVEELNQRLNDLVTSSQVIQQLCQQLDREIKKQDKLAVMIGSDIDNKTMWKRMDEKLNKIDKSLDQFRKDCDQMAIKIIETQQNIAGVNKKSTK